MVWTIGSAVGCRKAVQKGTRKSQEPASSQQSFVKLSVVTCLQAAFNRSQPWRLSGSITKAHVIEPLRLQVPEGPLSKESQMHASTSTAAARKPSAVTSELEAEIGNLLEQEGQKLPVQIEDDGERIRSLVARLTSNSIDELEGLGSDLTTAVRELQIFLKSEGERVQREIVNYAHLTETTLAAIKNIIETTFRPTSRSTGPRVDLKRAP